MPWAKSTVAPVECFLIHDDIPLPKTTFQSEMIRLREEAAAMAQLHMGMSQNPKYLDRRCRQLIYQQYGRICSHCDEQIILVFGVDPIFRKPDGADAPQYLHSECWRRLQRIATNKRRRITRAAKQDAELAAWQDQMALPAPPEDTDAPEFPGAVGEPAEEPSA